MRCELGKGAVGIEVVVVILFVVVLYLEYVKLLDHLGVATWELAIPRLLQRMRLSYLGGPLSPSITFRTGLAGVTSAPLNIGCMLLDILFWFFGTVLRYTLAGDVHAVFYSVLLLWRVEYENCRVHKTNILQVLSNYSDLELRQQLGKHFVWSIVVIDFTIWTVFQLIGARGNGTFGLPCLYVCMLCIVQGLLGPLSPKGRKRVDEIELPWFLERSLFHHVCAVVAVARYAEVVWMGLGSPNT